MKAPAFLVLSVLAVARPATAQMQPQPAGGDPHLQQVDYDPRQIVRLRGAPGYQVMVELSPDEQIQSVALGDSSAWQVSINKEGDRLFLKPARADATTNMTVVTSVRIYSFDLAALSGPSPDMPYTVQFLYPAPKRPVEDGQYVDVSAAMRRLSSYKMSGARQLWPSSISDDGRHTYISWPKTTDIPAVYAVDAHGKDMLVNGMMGTDDVYVVDGAQPRLTFRVDSQVAYAVRVNPKRTR